MPREVFATDNQKFHTGIGNRDIPAHVYILLKEIGKYMAETGCTLWSGGAIGVGTAFEEGCNLVDSLLKGIYLPWRNVTAKRPQIRYIACYS